MPKAKVSDIEMYYEIAGEGPPLLMSSGWSLAGRNFGSSHPILSQKYMCIRHDHRCMGRTDAPDGPLTLEQMADDLAGLLDHLKIERTRMIGGGGMGARVAMALAIRHPDRISALELGSAVLKSDNFSASLARVWKRMRALDPELWAEEVTLWSYTPNTYNTRPDIPEKAFRGRAGENTFPAPQAYDRIVDAMLAFDVRDTACQIKCPTLITSGGIEDLFSGPRYARAVHAAIPNSVLKIFEGAAHGYTGECHDEYIKLVLDWFEKHGD
ncbi:MAG: alpha/beta hydrolase [Chelatococcus sp.]|jgi:3-oxoadipate enol-lactonase|uniref:alpha/beta fold hydrolase n=1 Tax=Chelatococcus sp. TaxID=1953771 RepID=UPI0025C09B6D|nr:alpha/beta hydrolase [Chelatococcus sp.]MBX3538491.1 alpha/beta hydrolase [Chelatococcus sp.]